MAAVAVIAGSSDAANAATVTSPTPTCAAGDFLMAVCQGNSNPATPDTDYTKPQSMTGWTQRFAYNFSGNFSNYTRLAIYTRPVVGGEPSTFTFDTVNGSTTNHLSVDLLTIRNGDPTGITFGTVATDSFGASPLPVPGVTNPTNGLAFLAATGFDGFSDVDAPASGWTKWFKNSPMVTCSRSTAGATGTANVVINGSGFNIGVAFIIPEATGGGGTPQTVNAQVATLSLTAVPGAKTTGAVTQPAQVAALTLTAVAGTKTAGPVTKPGQVAALALTAVPGVETVGPVTQQAQVAALTLTAVPGTISAGGGTPQTVVAQIATLTLTPVAGTKTAGPVTQPAQVAALTLTPVAGTLTTGPVTWIRQVALLQLTAVPGSLAASVTRMAQIANLTLTAIAGTRTPGPTTKLAQPAALQLTAVPGIITLPFAMSGRSTYATADKAQRVQIRVSNTRGQWAVFVRGPEDVAIQRPGYFVAYTGTAFTWYRNGTLVYTQPRTLPLGEGVITLECRAFSRFDPCLLFVNHVLMSTWDFDPRITTDDGHQGFGSYGGAGLVITDAAGGGLTPIVPVTPDDPWSDPLIPTRWLATTRSKLILPASMSSDDNSWPSAGSDDRQPFN